MTKKQKKKFLSKLKEIDSNIDYPNSGGCAIIAYAIVKWLKELDPNIKAVPYFIFSGKKDRAFVSLSKGIPDSCDHAVVRIGNTYYDSRLNVPKKALIERSEVLESLDMEHLRMCINTRAWNSMFSRRQIPEIGRILSIDLSELNINYKGEL